MLQNWKYLGTAYLICDIDIADLRVADYNQDGLDDIYCIVIFSGVLYLSCLVNKEWTMYCCEQ